MNGTNQKYDVADHLHMSDDALELVVDSMISYVKGQSDDAQVSVMIEENMQEFFTDYELKHLADVRALIQKVMISMLALFFVFISGEVFLIRKRNYKAIAYGVYGAWGILLILSAIIGIVACVDLHLVIDGFHRLCFTNSNWVLNPALHRSVWMFFNNMYVDVLLRIGAIVGATAIATIGGVVWMRRVKK